MTVKDWIYIVCIMSAVIIGTYFLVDFCANNFVISLKIHKP